MRLTQIKLSGFKSFVDPTIIHVPSQLVGIVGPNGCGKSNVIDAVRWVLGESKASELRGESMLDVIFNGSTYRKPAARASVELVFDNSLGKITGQWGAFAEISVKRVLTRDATSSYFINQQQVRRRDIHDMFMGTGLGSKGYAIIGQGMISRIIEARPEELRVFLEEAAGVSRYKERRRETENRLSDTRDNLLRLEDIQQELSTQLIKLEEQAQVARHYQELQRQGQARMQQFCFLKKREAEADYTKYSLEMAQANRDLESAGAELSTLNLSIEELRQAHYKASDAVQTAQTALYDANAHVSRLEAEIRYTLESQQRVQQHIVQTEQQATRWYEEIQQHTDHIEQLTQQQENSVYEYELVQERLAQAHEQLPVLEAQVATWQLQQQDKRLAVSQLEQSLALMAQKQADLSKQRHGLHIKKERAEYEKKQINPPDATRLKALADELGSLREQSIAIERRQLELEAQTTDLEKIRSAAEDQLNQERVRLTQIEAKLSTLTEVQQQALASGALPGWLNKHGLSSLPPLWSALTVESPWATALEAVLQDKLHGLEVSRLDLVQGFLSDAPPVSQSFFSLESAQYSSDVPSVDRLPLHSKISSKHPHLLPLVREWLAQVYVADSLSDAIRLRDQLPVGACFVLSSGHRVTRDSVTFYASDNEQASVLSRQQALEALEQALTEQHTSHQQASSTFTLADRALSEHRQALAQCQSENGQVKQRIHALELEYSHQTQRQVQIQQQYQHLDALMAELTAQHEELYALELEAEEAFEGFDQRLGEQQMQLEEILSELDTAKQQLADATQAYRQLERQEQALAFDKKGIHNKINDLQQSVSNLSVYLRQSKDDIARHHEELAMLRDNEHQAALEEALVRRVDAEDHMRLLRIQLDDLSTRLRQSDEQRLLMERSLEPRRIRINELMLKQQAARLTQEQYEQQLNEHDLDIAALTQVVDALPKDQQRPQWLQHEMQKINQQINELGAVNLAAVQELDHAHERQGFLQKQALDLQQAMDTLEDAIRRIDRETRQLLQSTFNTVNGYFGELFPSLFGGGEAKLVMTGDEILDAGVQVMAQPPGKKNSTIHLLSGGEKALTATALVFAMFKLNPAPFCLLDEVDAPLDDANTERYANLVKKMSTHTQFLFISHNKIAMEMANQLIGVTMQEQGVSRVVSVDIEFALQLSLE